MRQKRLEVKCQPATQGPRGLHQINGPPILAEDRHITLGEKIADLDDYVHMSSQRLAAADWLAQEYIEERIALSGGGVEHIYRGERTAALESVGGNPMGLGTRGGATQFSG